MVLVIIILFGTAIIGRLIFLQILKHDYYQALAKGQQTHFLENIQERGEVFLTDKEGNLYPLAINKNCILVYASPNEIQDRESASKVLSSILNLDQDWILAKIQKSDTLYQGLKNRLSGEEEFQVKKAGIAGVYLKKEICRYYPQDDLNSHLIGFVGGEGGGQYGIEGYYNEVLKGSDYGSQTVDLILTVDYNLQVQAEQLLKQYQEKLGFEEGQILILEPKTGKIKALAHFPGFNPNSYNTQADLAIFQNGALQKIFEPGSVFKPLTMAGALEEQKISPDTRYTDKGYVKIGGITLYNYDERVWGERTMTEVLEKSINTGAVFAESQLGHPLFLEYLENFGFFEPTGLDLQGEVYSANAEFKKGYEVNFATASFGQGIEITPIQLARGYAAIANGGHLVKPYVVEKMKKGTKVIDSAPAISSKAVISTRTASQLTAMLVSVVKNGFAKSARVPGYYLAGKTGTAQVPYSALGIKKTGYSDKTIQTFVGFGPAFDPKFLILVKLNNPKTKTAEYSAVPLFQEMAKYTIDYWQLPPDYEN